VQQKNYYGSAKHDCRLAIPTERENRESEEFTCNAISLASTA